MSADNKIRTRQHALDHTRLGACLPCLTHLHHNMGIDDLYFLSEAFTGSTVKLCMRCCMYLYGVRDSDGFALHRSLSLPQDTSVQSSEVCKVLSLDVGMHLTEDDKKVRNICVPRGQTRRVTPQALSHSYHVYVQY